MVGKTRITAKQKSARRRNIKIAQATKKRGGGARRKAGKAFKKAYKESRSMGNTKSFSRLQGHRAAMKRSPKAGSKLAGSFARGHAKRTGIKSKSGRTAYGRGYTRAIRQHIRSY